MPVIGNHVTVADPANFYNGREAVVTDITVYNGVIVYTVAIGSVTFALRGDRVAAH